MPGKPRVHYFNVVITAGQNKQEADYSKAKLEDVLDMQSLVSDQLGDCFHTIAIDVADRQFDSRNTIL